ncbi:hypothetical protein [Pseudoduganella armeniaca]|uniref:Uncharacterized protein n=1 Tax=Pseudoduganella armeniaca TaxID=2072590 RepID=A0A2R4CB70_9BURK|nr:hypothetical protein [Pseudoduganella armeniaca]AVR96894.1 hypothetical protein C9I28_15385 [Pseudoduganella armeniaca]
MNIDLYKRKARYHGRLYNLGGKGGSSQANTSTATTTTTSTMMVDKSMQGGDNAVGLNGNSNLVDKSVVNNTSFTDTSNRSTNFSDMSNRSTNLNDSSNRSTVNNTTYTSTDFGSVSKALDGMGKTSAAALDLSGKIVEDGIKGLAVQSKDNLAVIDKAFAFASSSSAADAQKYTDVLGFAKDTISKSNAAFAEAKDGGTNKTLQIAAVATVAVVGLAFALKD